MATTIKAAKAPVHASGKSGAYPRTVTFGAPKRARTPKISTKRAAGKRMGRGA